MERELEVLHKVAEQKGTALDIIFKRSFDNDMKSCELSEKHGKAGDDLLEQQDEPKDHKYFLAFEQYCKSILCAPKDSEHLALSYKRRSDLLFRINKYKDCLKNIDFSLEITKSHELKIELLGRKANCLQKLGILKENNIFTEVESCMNFLDDTHKTKYSDSFKESMTLIIDNPTNSKDNVNYLSEDDTELISDRVKVSKYDDKIGHYLEAARDFNAGELILVEKPLCFSTSPTTDSTNCNYCLKTAWSGIPCEDCNKAMFCSVECKDKANELYHDVECLILPHAEFRTYDYYIKLCLRAVIISMKKAGSVAELRNKIQHIRDNPDPRLNGVFCNGRYHGDLTDFLYPLDDKFYRMCRSLENRSLKIFEILICFIKHTKIFRQFPHQTIEVLVNNDDLMFIGSLILRLEIILDRLNPYIFSSKLKNCEFGQPMWECEKILLCCYNGMCLNSLTSIMDNLQSLNASRCCTENNEIKIFALRPIKKGDRLSVGRTHDFHKYEAEEKKNILKEYFSDTFFSDPLAGREWRFLLQIYPFGGTNHLEISHDFSQILFVFLRYMIMENVDCQLGRRDLERLIEAITDLAEKSPQAKTSFLMYSLIRSLELSITHVYGMKPFWEEWNRVTN